MKSKEKRCKYLIYLGLIIITGMASSCEPEEKVYLALNFELPVNITPSKSEFKVGDTILIEINFPIHLLDHKREHLVPFEGFDFYGMTRFNRLANASNSWSDQPGANNVFKVNNIVGGIYPFSEAGAEITYEMKDNHFVMKSELICQNQGVFSISFMTGTDINKNPSEIMEEKIIGRQQVYYKVNDGVRNNNHLIMENTSTVFDDSVIKTIGNQSFFSFKIK